MLGRRPLSNSGEGLTWNGKGASEARTWTIAADGASPPVPSWAVAPDSSWSCSPWCSGVDPRQFMGDGRRRRARRESGPKDPAEERMAEFSKVIFKDTEDVWDEQFRVMGKVYKQPTLVLFSDQVESACGMQSAAVGPFYCPNDGKVYIDLSFFNTLEKQLGAPGEFARAYVLAHEVGHHVQRLLGILRPRRRGSPDDEPDRVQQDVRSVGAAGRLPGRSLGASRANESTSSFRRATSNRPRTPRSASATTCLQKQARGRVSPDGFTHGTAKQRQRWFLEGFNTGDVKKARELFDLPYEKL